MKKKMKTKKTSKTMKKMVIILKKEVLHIKIIQDHQANPH